VQVCGTGGFSAVQREIKCRHFRPVDRAEEYFSRFLNLCPQPMPSLIAVDFKLSSRDRQVYAEELCLLAERAPNISSLTVNIRVDDSVVSAIFKMVKLEFLTITTFTGESACGDYLDIDPLAFHALCKGLLKLKYLKLVGVPMVREHGFCVESRTLQTLSIIKSPFGRPNYYIDCPQLRQLYSDFSKPCIRYGRNGRYGTKHVIYSASASNCLQKICEHSPYLRLINNAGDLDLDVIFPAEESHLGRLRGVCGCGTCTQA